MFKPKLFFTTSFLSCLLSAAGAQTKKSIPSVGSLTTVKSFSQPLTTAVFTTKFVVNDKHDIVLVRCEPDDGALMFYSADKFADYESVAKVVGLGQILKMDPTLLQIPDLKPGFCARRIKKAEPWIVEKIKK